MYIGGWFTVGKGLLAVCFAAVAARFFTPPPHTAPTGEGAYRLLASLWFMTLKSSFSMILKRLLAVELFPHGDERGGGRVFIHRIRQG